MGVYDELDKYTSTALLQTALNEARSDVDRREGSILFDTLAPLATVAAGLFEVLKSVCTNTTIQAATGEFLDLVGSQFGIYRTGAMAAVRTIEVIPNSVSFSVGDSFQTKDGLNLFWTVSQDIGGGIYAVVCQTPGSDGGADYGGLTPVDSVQGLQSVQFKDTWNAGANAEQDELFRIRIWKELQKSSYGGNFEDYKRWVFSGFQAQPNGAKITGMEIFPAWNGGGTVKIIPFIENDGLTYAKPDNTIINNLKAYLDPIDNAGKGAGVVPIGHRVTVEPINNAYWYIHCVVRLRDGQTVISEETRAAAEADLREAIQSEIASAITKPDDPFPGENDYTFSFTSSMVINAIMGNSSTSRFLSVQNITVNSVDWYDVSWTQEANYHWLPELMELTLEAV